MTLDDVLFKKIIEYNLESLINMDKNSLFKILKAYLFQDYITNHGFNPNNYEQILELNQDVLGSISIYLKDYQQFLLSTKVDYSHLHEFDILGAKGYVESNGIYVPKSIEADNHFFGGYLPKVPYKRHWYAYPKIGEDFCEYDVTISNGIANEDNFDLILKSNMDLYLGDVLDITDKNYKNKRKQLLNTLKNIKDNSNIDLNISTDKNSYNNIECILLSRRK